MTCDWCWPRGESGKMALSGCASASTASRAPWSRSATSTGLPGNESGRSSARRWPSCATPRAPTGFATTSINSGTPAGDRARLDAPPAGLVTELSVRAGCFGGRRYSQLLDPGDGVGGDVDVEVGLVGGLVVGDAEVVGVA